MSATNSPDDRHDTVVATGPNPRFGLYRRADVTTRRLLFRLGRPVSAKVPPVWGHEMTLIVLGGILLTLVAALADSYFVPFASRSQSPFMGFLRDVTDSMKSGWYIVPAVIVVAIIGLMDWRHIELRSRRSLMIAYGRAAFILGAVAVPGITVNIIKQIVGRARPQMLADYGMLGFSPFHFDHAFQSFPSGHATTAGSLAMILILWHPRWRWPLGLLMFVLAFARVPAGAHYPSDIAAGFSLGAIMALVLARWLARRRAVFTLRKGGFLPVLVG